MIMKLAKHVLSSVLALGMLLSLLPVAALAAGDTSAPQSTTLAADGENDDLVLNKTATLEDDGTYTIKLEAYATGDVTTETTVEKEPVPADIILILDQSGSMSDDMDGIPDGTFSTAAVANANINDGSYYCLVGDQYYQVTAAKERVSEETESFVYTYTYANDDGDIVTVGTSETGTEATVDAANASITLYTQNTFTGSRLDGLKYAVNKFIESIEGTGVNHRVAVVGFASDGYKHGHNGTLNWENTELFVGRNQYNYNAGKTGTNDAASHYGEALQDVSTAAGKTNIANSIDALSHSGATYPQWGFTMAQGIYANSSPTYTKEDGTEGTRNRIVIFFTDGYPGYNVRNPDASEANATIAKSQTLQTDYGADVYCVACIESLKAGSGGDTYMKAVSSDGTYQNATSAKALSAFFEMIEKEVTTTTITTTVTLTENAILVDELSNDFTVPSDFSTANNVTLQTAKHMGYGSFASPVDATGLTVTERTDSQNQVTGINVSGFDYLGSNMVTTDDSGDSVNASGSKLIVTITGLLARDSAATGNYVDTNTAAAGIWDKDNHGQWAQIKAFPMPRTLLDQKTFVLDYAKQTPMSVYNAAKVDSADDGLFSKVDASCTGLTGRYGTVDAANGLNYTPGTTLWDGWDTFYALGRDAEKGDSSTQNIWSKVSVLPANNVYYEDTFATSEATGTVGIVYSASGWQTVTEEGGGTNTGDAANDEHGWITSMDDDGAYSDGTAATGTAGATATFSFTGTGVDIYSRTDMTTGLAIVKLYAGKDTTSAAKMVKSLTVDNLAQAGTYYQIPTVSFSGLAYGTYTVKLTVASTSKTTGTVRSTYYLDGIRVYNPLSAQQEAEPIVKDAYGDEIGASFQSVRDILIDANSLEDGATNVDGAVFIDFIPQEGDAGTATTTTIGTYVDYGPKNEVYLAQGQAIAFNVGTGMTKISVGLKAPDGTTKALVTNGENTSELEIEAASDQYFVIAPNQDGCVIIKNTGTNLLSVTKLKISGDAAETTTFSADLDTVMTYANSFDSRPVMAYTLSDAETGSSDQVPAQEDTVIESQEEPEQGTVAIENPEEPVQESPSAPASDNWIGRLFQKIRKFI